MPSGPPYRAISMRVNRPDQINLYVTGIDRITELGADTVCLICEAHRDTPSASQMYLDYRWCPTYGQILKLVEHAHHRHLRVMLMPVVVADHADPAGPRPLGWNPDSWDDFHQSYRAILGHFAEIADQSHVDLLCIGSGLSPAEYQTAQWENHIPVVKAYFKGPLTYVARWDHYTAPKFWNQMDYIGVDASWPPAGHDGPTAEAVPGTNQPRCQELLAFAARQKKPLLLVDAGWCSSVNAAKDPVRDAAPAVPVDLDIQKLLYEEFLAAWPTGNSLLAGIVFNGYVPEADGKADNGRSPFGKPAEAVLRQWLARPRWQVRQVNSAEQ